MSDVNKRISDLATLLRMLGFKADVQDLGPGPEVHVVIGRSVYFVSDDGLTWRVWETGIQIMTTGHRSAVVYLLMGARESFKENKE